RKLMIFEWILAKKKNLGTITFFTFWVFHAYFFHVTFLRYLFHVFYLNFFSKIALLMPQRHAENNIYDPLIKHMIKHQIDLYEYCMGVKYWESWGDCCT